MAKNKNHSILRFNTIIHSNFKSLKDSYKTIENPSEETLFKDRNSKFFGYAFPVLNEDDVKNALDRLKKNIIRHVTFVMLGSLEQKPFASELTTMENPIILQECRFMDKFKLLRLRIY